MQVKNRQVIFDAFFNARIDEQSEKKMSIEVLLFAGASELAGKLPDIFQEISICGRLRKARFAQCPWGQKRENKALPGLPQGHFHKMLVIHCLY